MKKLALLAAAAVTLISTGAWAKSLVVPHLVETVGRITTAPNAFDTSLMFTYTAGLAGSPAGAGASIDLYLFEGDNGDVMRSQTKRAVCNPCSFQLSANVRKRTVALEDLIVQAGGFDRHTKTGYAVIVIGGADPDAVSLAAFLTGSGTAVTATPAVVTVLPVHPLAAAQ